MPDTRSPYDDEVRDPYDGDDVKNPHDEVAGSADEPGEPEAADRPEASRRRPGRPRKGT